MVVEVALKDANCLRSVATLQIEYPKLRLRRMIRVCTAFHSACG